MNSRIEKKDGGTSCTCCLLNLYPTRARLMALKGESKSKQKRATFKKGILLFIFMLSLVFALIAGGAALHQTYFGNLSSRIETCSCLAVDKHIPTCDEKNADSENKKSFCGDKDESMNCRFSVCFGEPAQSVVVNTSIMMFAPSIEFDAYGYDNPRESVISADQVSHVKGEGDTFGETLIGMINSDSNKPVNHSPFTFLGWSTSDVGEGDAHYNNIVEANTVFSKMSGAITLYAVFGITTGEEATSNLRTWVHLSDDDDLIPIIKLTKTYDPSADFGIRANYRRNLVNTLITKISVSFFRVEGNNAVVLPDGEFLIASNTLYPQNGAFDISHNGTYRAVYSFTIAVNSRYTYATTAFMDFEINIKQLDVTVLVNSEALDFGSKTLEHNDDGYDVDGLFWASISNLVVFSIDGNPDTLYAGNYTVRIKGKSGIDTSSLLVQNCVYKTDGDDSWYEFTLVVMGTMRINLVYENQKGALWTEGSLPELVGNVFANLGYQPITESVPFDFEFVGWSLKSQTEYSGESDLVENGDSLPTVTGDELVIYAIWKLGGDKDNLFELPDSPIGEDPEGQTERVDYGTIFGRFINQIYLDGKQYNIGHTLSAEIPEDFYLSYRWHKYDAHENDYVVISGLKGSAPIFSTENVSDSGKYKLIITFESDVFEGSFIRVYTFYVTIAQRPVAVANIAIKADSTDARIYLLSDILEGREMLCYVYSSGNTFCPEIFITAPVYGGGNESTRLVLGEHYYLTDETGSDVDMSRSVAGDYRRTITISSASNTVSNYAHSIFEFEWSILRRSLTVEIGCLDYNNQNITEADVKEVIKFFDSDGAEVMHDVDFGIVNNASKDAFENITKSGIYDIAVVLFGTGNYTPCLDGLIFDDETKKYKDTLGNIIVFIHDGDYYICTTLAVNNASLLIVLTDFYGSLSGGGVDVDPYGDTFPDTIPVPNGFSSTYKFLGWSLVAGNRDYLVTDAFGGRLDSFCSGAVTIPDFSDSFYTDYHEAVGGSFIAGDRIMLYGIWGTDYDGGNIGEPEDPDETYEKTTKIVVVERIYNHSVTTDLGFSIKYIVEDARATYSLFYGAFDGNGERVFKAELGWASEDILLVAEDTLSVTIKGIKNVAHSGVYALVVNYKLDTHGEVINTTETYYFDVRISPKTLSAANVDIAPANYDGTAKSPTAEGIVVTDNSYTLDSDEYKYTTDTDVRIDAGEYSFDFKFEGNYTGTATKSFEIINNIMLMFSGLKSGWSLSGDYLIEAVGSGKYLLLPAVVFNGEGSDGYRFAGWVYAPDPSKTISVGSSLATTVSHTLSASWRFVTDNDDVFLLEKEAAPFDKIDTVFDGLGHKISATFLHILQGSSGIVITYIWEYSTDDGINWIIAQETVVLDAIGGNATDLSYYCKDAITATFKLTVFISDGTEIAFKSVEFWVKITARDIDEDDIIIAPLDWTGFAQEASVCIIDKKGNILSFPEDYEYADAATGRIEQYATLKTHTIRVMFARGGNYKTANYDSIKEKYYIDKQFAFAEIRVYFDFAGVTPMLKSGATGTLPTDRTDATSYYVDEQGKYKDLPTFDESDRIWSAKTGYKFAGWVFQGAAIYSNGSAVALGTVHRLVATWRLFALTTDEIAVAQKIDGATVDLGGADYFGKENGEGVVYSRGTTYVITKEAYHTDPDVLIEYNWYKADSKNDEGQAKNLVTSGRILEVSNAQNQLYLLEITAFKNGMLIDTDYAYIKVNIMPKVLTADNVFDIPEAGYTGKMQTPDISIWDGAYRLNSGSSIDFRINNQSFAQMGTHSIEIEFVGNYASAVAIVKDFTITPIIITFANIKGANVSPVTIIGDAVYQNLPKSIKAEGYTFVRWTHDGVVVADGESLKTLKNHILEAVWTLGVDPETMPNYDESDTSDLNHPSNPDNIQTGGSGVYGFRIENKTGDIIRAYRYNKIDHLTLDIMYILGDQITFTYRWDYSLTRDGSYSPLAGQTGKSMSVTNVTDSGWYRLMIVVTDKEGLTFVMPNGFEFFVDISAREVTSANLNIQLKSNSSRGIMPDFIITETSANGEVYILEYGQDYVITPESGTEFKDAGIHKIKFTFMGKYSGEFEVDFIVEDSGKTEELWWLWAIAASLTFVAGIIMCAILPSFCKKRKKQQG